MAPLNLPFVPNNPLFPLLLGNFFLILISFCCYTLQAQVFDRMVLLAGRHPVGPLWSGSGALYMFLPSF